MAYKVDLDQEKNQYRIEFSGPVKGIDTKSPLTSIIEGHVPDMDAVSVPGGTVNRINGYALHDTTMTLPGAAVPTLLDRYYPSSGSAGECYIAAGNDGKIYKWDAAANTWGILRIGLSTAAGIWWSSCQLADYLIFSNPTDGNWKYDGTRVIPIGAKHIADMESGEATWATGSADTVLYKQGVQGRKTGVVAAGATTTMTLTPATAWNLTTALLQGAAYTTLDKIHFWVNIDDTTHLDTAGTWIRFGNAGDTIYFQLTAAGWGSLANGWNEISVLKSAFTATGAADWGTIAKMSLATKAQVGNLNVTYDDVYMIYANPMPAVQISVTWKNMYIGMQTTLNPSDFMYSKVSAPDYWDAAAVFPISQNDGQIIRGAHPYYNQVVIGKDNSVHSVGGSVAGTIYPNYNLEHILITTEHGCSSHRSMVEAGNRIYMWWRHEIHRYFGTGTEKVSYKIDNTLGSTVSGVNPTYLVNTVGARYRLQNELYFWWTPLSQTTNTRLLKYDYIEDAFLPVTAVTMAVAKEVYDGGQEYLISGDYSGNVWRQDSGGAYNATPITAYITFPWTSAQHPDQMKSWDELELMYVNNTGNLVIDMRTADHPWQMSTAAYVTVGTVDMSVVDVLGRIRLGTQRSRWMQLRLTTVGAYFTLFMPLIIYATPLSQKY